MVNFRVKKIFLDELGNFEFFFDLKKTYHISKDIYLTHDEK
jgi:hypothetical protein